MLEAQQVSVVRGGRAILDEVSMPFASGRVSAILGPNGAGKSTLLRVLSGSLVPDAGQVCLDGQALAHISKADLARRRGVLAQESMLQFDYSVEEVVILGRIPHLSGWESPQDIAAAHRALAEVGLAALAHRRYPSLSGGEKQRVHLARVLAQLDVSETLPPGQNAASRWLLLDEPTSALDLHHQHAVLSHARRLTLSGGPAVIAVLHDLNLALRYADDVLLLSEGRVAAAGPTHEALQPPVISRVYGVHAEMHCPAACPFLQIHPVNPSTSHV